MKKLYPELETLSEKTVAFAQQSHQQTLKTWTNSPNYHKRYKGILHNMQDPQNIAYCEEHRDKMYHFLQDENYPKGVYRVSSSAMYRAGKPDWQILFSVANFDDILGDDVYLSSIIHCETAPHLVLIELSPKGADCAYVIEYNLQNKCIVKDGFHLPLGKSDITWQTENSVWVCPAWLDEQCTQAGYSGEVWLWQRGQDFADATAILQANLQKDMSCEAWRYLDTQGSPLDMISVSHDFYHSSYYILQDNQLHQLSLPQDSKICGYLYGFLIIHLHSDWIRANQSYVSGSLIAVKLHKGVLGNAQVLFTPNQSQSIESVITSRQYIVLHYLEHVSGSLKAWHYQQGVWLTHPTPDLTQIHGHQVGLSLELVDQPYGGDIFYFTIESPLHPPTLYTWNAYLQEVCILRKQKPAFSTENLTIHQYFATASDGQKIPYFWYGPKQANTNTPTLIYTYGGFGVSTLPYYSASIGQFWLEQGGAFVIANIRGGAEYGIAWHQQAIGTQKITAVTDLCSVTQDLQQRKLSTPQHCAWQGGSNGGLIVASAMAHHPELVQSVVCEMPIIDMLSYHTLGAGHSWLAEYGNPEEVLFQQALSQLSPIHQINDKKDYPLTLITTDLNDDRTHPAHALKLHAHLQACHQQSWLYLNDSGGHAGNTTQDIQAMEFAVILEFLWQTIG